MTNFAKFQEKDLMNLQETFDKIRLEKESHTYFHKETGEIYQSVSDFVGQFKNRFDPGGQILEKCAAKKGITTEQLRAEWDKIAKDARDFGTGVHSDLEYYIKNKTIRKSIYEVYVREFKKFKFDGQILSEQIVYSEKYKIAGTLDFLEIIDDNRIRVLDFKSNKKLDMYSVYKKRLLPPLTHLHDCSFNLYQLQVSAYAFLLDEQGVWVNDLSILHINKKTQKIDVYPVEYKRKEIMTMLAHNKQQTEKTVQDFDF